MPHRRRTSRRRPRQDRCRCASPPAPCCVPRTGKHPSARPGSLRGVAGVVQRGRRQGVAGHRHDRAGHRAHVRRAFAGGFAAGVRTDGAARVDRRSHARPWGWRSWRSAIGSMPVKFDEVLRWSQTVIDLAGGDPTKGAGFGFGIAAGGRGGVSRHCAVVAGPPRVAPRPRRRRRDGPKHRRGNTRRCRRLELRFRDLLTGCFGPMTPWCARSEEALQIAAEASNDTALTLARVHPGGRAAESGHRSRPPSRAGADGAGPRVGAQACALHGPRRRDVDRQRKRPGKATAMLP